MSPISGYIASENSPERRGKRKKKERDCDYYYVFFVIPSH
jgi:hypothetical protein